MGKPQRDKGGRGERLVTNMLKPTFPDAHRNLNDKVDRRGTDVYAGNMAIQVKYWANYAPLSKFDEIQDYGTKIRALVTKATKDPKKPWMISMTLDDFLEICQDIGTVYKE